MDQLMSFGGVGGSSNRHACAACKHQRKKCPSSCLLAPYFPGDKTEEFQAVHRVFGVSNIRKMLIYLDRGERDEAAKSFMWEASAWTKDPVHGPLGLYRQLEQELHEMKLKILQKQEQQTLQCNSELRLSRVTPPEGNSTGERQACVTANNEQTTPNCYYNQNNSYAPPPPPGPPQYTVVQGQQGVNQGRGLPIDQTVTLAEPATAAERGQGVVNYDHDRASDGNIASIHQYVRSATASYNTPARYQGNNSFPGGETSLGNHGSFWQGQGTRNYQTGGQNIAQPYAASATNVSSNYYWPSNWDNLVQRPQVGQDVNHLAFQQQQQQQQQQRMLNSNQLHYIHGK